MAVCNLDFNACSPCISSGKSLVQLQDKKSYCCIKDAADFLRPIEFTYTNLSQCSVEEAMNWMVAGSVGFVCVLALIAFVAYLCIRFRKTSARRQPDEETGLLGTGRCDYGFHAPAVQMICESFQASQSNFELIALDEVVVEGQRRLGDNQMPRTGSFKANFLKTTV